VFTYISFQPLLCLLLVLVVSYLLLLLHHLMILLLVLEARIAETRWIGRNWKPQARNAAFIKRRNFSFHHRSSPYSAGTVNTRATLYTSLLPLSPYSSQRCARPAILFSKTSSGSCAQSNSSQNVKGAFVRRHMIVQCTGITRNMANPLRGRFTFRRVFGTRSTHLSGTHRSRTYVHTLENNSPSKS
jgi:hypothetical protein